MAKKLQEFPSTRGRRAGDSIYPWDQWFNGEIWELSNGEDFTATKTENFRGAISTAAKQRKLKVRTAIINDGKSIVVQMTGPLEEK